MCFTTAHLCQRQEATVFMYLSISGYMADPRLLALIRLAEPSLHPLKIITFTVARH